MNEPKPTKDVLIEKLKKGSKWIAVLCLLAVLFNVLAFVMEMNSIRNYTNQAITHYVILRQSISYGLSIVIMSIAALMFFRIAKAGIPFTAKNVRSVRIIGILFLLTALIPAVIAACMRNDFTSMFMVPNSSALIEGLLFLFIAHIIRYGAMLQQESDETL